MPVGLAIMAGIDLAFKIFQKLNVTADQAVTFYHTVIRPANPDAPDLTDAEIIEKMRSGFESEREIAEAARTALRSGEAPVPTPGPALRMTTDSGTTPTKTSQEFRDEKHAGHGPGDGAPSADRVGSPKPGTPPPTE